MSNASFPAPGHVLAAVFGLMIGGLVVVLATKAIPRMSSQMMAQKMQKMMPQMQVTGVRHRKPENK